MTGRDECRNFCPENSRKNRKKGLQNRNIHAIIPGVSTRRRTGIGMSPSGKAPDFDSGISSVQIRPSQPYDLLAQSAEQLPFKQWVRGSNPRQVTRATTETWWLFLFNKLPRKHCFRGNLVILTYISLLNGSVTKTGGFARFLCSIGFQRLPYRVRDGQGLG